MDRTVNTATAQQGAVRGVDNGIDAHLGDVIPDNFKGHVCSPTSIAIIPVIHGLVCRLSLSALQPS